MGGDSGQDNVGYRQNIPSQTGRELGGHTAYLLLFRAIGEPSWESVSSPCLVRNLSREF